MSLRGLDSGLRQLGDEVRAALADEDVTVPAMRAKLVGAHLASLLSARGVKPVIIQSHVRELRQAGLSPREIADQLGVSVNSVSKAMSREYRAQGLPDQRLRKPAND
jgi:DNA-binding NarL/FixJ family response regulator